VLDVARLLTQRPLGTLSKATLAMLVDTFRVDSSSVAYTDEHITSTYAYATTETAIEDGAFVVRPVAKTIKFQTKRKVPKVGCVLQSHVRFLRYMAWAAS
jgi:hypothetical protein